MNLAPWASRRPTVPTWLIHDNLVEAEMTVFPSSTAWCHRTVRTTAAAGNSNVQEVHLLHRTPVGERVGTSRCLVCEKSFTTLVVRRQVTSTARFDGQKCTSTTELASLVAQPTKHVGVVSLIHQIHHLSSAKWIDSVLVVVRHTFQPLR